MTDDREDAFRVSWPAGADRVPGSFFDGLYAGAEDPWALGERWYEERKYELTVASLPRPAYERGLEVGCSVGLLTVRLAGRCDSLLTGDVAEQAVQTTEERIRQAGFAAGTVSAQVMEPPERWPEGSFDLIVLSEVLYYAAGERLDRFIDGSVERLRPGGHLVAVHYRPEADVHLLTGDVVHQRLRERAGPLHRVVGHEEPDFLLDVWERPLS